MLFLYDNQILTEEAKSPAHPLSYTY